MLDNFDFNLLDDPEFLEDAVREEIIYPIIRELGYSSSGEHRIVRSRRLEHPFVSIGSSRIKISIIPDYLLLIESEPFLVLEAKAPQEKIVKSKHCEQVYSYAIHPEVRSKYYALCNGKEFLLFHVGKLKPVLHFKVKEINNHMGVLKKILGPTVRANHELLEYKPDCGLFFLKTGKKPRFVYILYRVHTNNVMMVAPEKFTTSTTVKFGEQEFVASFDFDKNKLNKLLRVLPKDQAKYIRRALSSQPFRADLRKDEIMFGVVSELGNVMHENNEEQYVPFVVKEFRPYLRDC